jgi:dsRNA-specific ribonuclease
MDSLLLSAEKRAEIEAILGYNFKNSSLLDEAMWTAGPTKIAGRSIPDSNKGLAQLGDSMLRMIVNTRSRHAGYSKGQTNSKWKEYVSNNALAIAGKNKAIWPYLLVNNQNQQVTKNLLATAVQALIGAVWEIMNRVAERMVGLEKV